MKNSRGVENIVAVALVLLISVSVVGVLYSHFSSDVEKKVGTIERVPDFSIVSSEGYTVYYSDSRIASVQVKRGSANSNVKELQIIFSIDGNDYSFRVSAPNVSGILPLKNEARTYFFNFSKEGISGSPDYVSIAPIYFDGRIGKIIYKVKMPVVKNYVSEEKEEKEENKTFVFHYSSSGGGSHHSSGGGSSSPVTTPQIINETNVTTNQTNSSVCGDLSCDIDENCSRCPEDCGECIPEVFIYGTSGNDVFQVYNESVWVNGNYTNSSNYSVLVGNGGNDTFVTVGDGKQIIIGNINGSDSFWIDLNDSVVNMTEDELESNFHNISEYAQPWTNDSSNESYVKLNSRGEVIKDPYGDNGLNNSLGFSNYTYFKDVPLFENDTMSYVDVNQGQVGDCWLMGALGILGYNDPKTIRQAIIAIGDGNYIVRLYRNTNYLYDSNFTIIGYLHSSVEYYKIDADLPIQNNGDLVYAKLGNYNKRILIDEGNATGSLWVPLIEKAYAYFRYNKNNYSVLSGGMPYEVYSAIGNFTGIKRLLNSSIDNETDLSFHLNDIIVAKDYTTSAVTWSSNQMSSLGSSFFVSNHVYSILNISGENSSSYLKVYNPWGQDGKMNLDEDMLDGILDVNMTIARAGISSYYYH